jgi:type II secretory pathway pseudopilin PulG
MTTNTLAGRALERGFSILELMIVMAIVIIMIGVALFSLPTAQRALAVDNAGAQLVDNLRFAQQRALSEREMMRVEITPGTGTTPGTIVVVDQNRIAPGASDDVIVRNETLAPNSEATIAPDLAGFSPPPSPFDFIAPRFSGGKIKLWFSPEGPVVNNATPAIPQSFTMVYYTPAPNGTPDPESTRALTLFGPTGAIRSWRYDPTSMQFQEM